MHTLRLHKGREQSVLRRHPWIFSRAISSDITGLADGETLLIADAKGNVIGTGHYQNSSLSVRLIAFEEVNPDAGFWRSRLQDALTYRRALGFIKPGHTDAFRLAHGEGDQLPGLIIDIYGQVAVVQAHSIGMYKAANIIAEAVTSLTGLTLNGVYLKSKDALPSDFGLHVQDRWLVGSPAGELWVHESGISFLIDVEKGQKTGFFLDQRDNRELVRRYAQGKEVLNCFCYTGGFSLYALQGGATAVTSVDTSAPALETLEKNVAANGFPGSHLTVKDDVLPFLSKDHTRYDIVIVDPPAFAKSLAKRHNAVQAYKRLNILAMSRVKPGGMLFTFSCSQVVDKPLFHNTIVAAAIESGRHARIMHDLDQGPDHPASVYHPEGQYLKGLALYIG